MMYLPTHRKHNHTWSFALLLLLILTRSIQLPERVKEIRGHGVYELRLPQIAKAPEYHSLKKGLAGVYYPEETDYCLAAQTLGALKVYNWAPWLKDCPNVETIPMLWCGDGTGLVIHATSKILLEANEPDVANQCNTTPAAYVPVMRNIESNFPGYDLASPAPSHVYPQWLEASRAAYISAWGVPPNWKYLSMHCYAASLGGVAWCKANLRWYESKVAEWKIPGGILVTEFAFIPYADFTLADAIREESQWIDEMDANPLVRAYFRFTNTWDEKWTYCPECIVFKLLELDDTFTPAGQMYYWH